MLIQDSIENTDILVQGFKFGLKEKSSRTLEDEKKHTENLLFLNVFQCDRGQNMLEL